MIRLNLGVPELERLLGGNSEMEIEIRQAAAAEFAKRYLKDIVASETVKKAIQTIHSQTDDMIKAANVAVSDHISETFGTLKKKENGAWNSPSYTFTPNAEFKKHMDEFALKQFEKVVQKYYDEAYKKMLDALDDRVKRINAEIGAAILKQVNAEIVTQVKEQVQAKLKSIL